MNRGRNNIKKKKGPTRQNRKQSQPNTPAKPQCGLAKKGVCLITHSTPGRYNILPNKELGRGMYANRNHIEVWAKT